MKIVERIRQHVPWLEPWYDWGKTDAFRIDSVERDFSDESSAEVRYFELQWFGLHFAVQFGRTPPRIAREEVAENKRRYAQRAAGREEQTA